MVNVNNLYIVIPWGVTTVGGSFFPEGGPGTGPSGATIIPVSYTHLDVYKRQAEYESGSKACYPKFCMNGAGYGVYVGYSSSPNGNVTGTNYNNGWWPTQNGYIAELNKYPTHIRFNSAGRLQHYTEQASKNGPYEPIPSYATRSLTLTANNYIWQFVGGRLSYLAPNPTYTSGEIVGGNYKIKFDSQGYATSITTLDGGSVSDSAGNNYVSYTHL